MRWKMVAAAAVVLMSGVTVTGAGVTSASPVTVDHHGVTVTYDRAGGVAPTVSVSCPAGQTAIAEIGFTPEAWSVEASSKRVLSSSPAVSVTASHADDGSWAADGTCFDPVSGSNLMPDGTDKSSFRWMTGDPGLIVTYNDWNVLADAPEATLRCPAGSQAIVEMTFTAAAGTLADSFKRVLSAVPEVTVAADLNGHGDWLVEAYCWDSAGVQAGPFLPDGTLGKLAEAWTFALVYPEPVLTVPDPMVVDGVLDFDLEFVGVPAEASGWTSFEIVPAGECGPYGSIGTPPVAEGVLPTPDTVGPGPHPMSLPVDLPPGVYALTTTTSFDHIHIGPWWPVECATFTVPAVVPVPAEPVFTDGGDGVVDTVVLPPLADGLQWVDAVSGLPVPAGTVELADGEVFGVRVEPVDPSSTVLDGPIPEWWWTGQVPPAATTTTVPAPTTTVPGTSTSPTTVSPAPTTTTAPTATTVPVTVNVEDVPDPVAACVDGESTITVPVVDGGGWAVDAVTLTDDQEGIPLSADAGPRDVALFVGDTVREWTIVVPDCAAVVPVTAPAAGQQPQPTIPPTLPTAGGSGPATARLVMFAGVAVAVGVVLRRRRRVA